MSTKKALLHGEFGVRADYSGPFSMLAISKKDKNVTVLEGPAIRRSGLLKTPFVSVERRFKGWPDAERLLREMIQGIEEEGRFLHVHGRPNPLLFCGFRMPIYQQDGGMKFPMSEGFPKEWRQFVGEIVHSVSDMFFPEEVIKSCLGPMITMETMQLLSSRLTNYEATMINLGYGGTIDLLKNALGISNLLTQRQPLKFVIQDKVDEPHVLSIQGMYASMKRNEAEAELKKHGLKGMMVHDPNKKDETVH